MDGLPAERPRRDRRVHRGGSFFVAERVANRGLSLLAVFIVAKLAMLNGRPIPLSAWGPIAYF